MYHRGLFAEHGGFLKVLTDTLYFRVLTQDPMAHDIYTAIIAIDFW